MDESPEQSIDELREIVRHQAEELAAYHSVVHDIKMPLQMILGYAYILLDTDEPLSEELRDYLNGVMGAALRANRMNDELLLWAGVRAGGVSIEAVQVEPVIRAALDSNRQALEERGFSVVLADAFPAVMGYAPWIEVVLAILISNAVKSMSTDRTDPRITIRSFPQMIRFEVQDNGLGMKLDDQEHLNSMFSQLHKEHDEGPKLGLPLYIVTRIVTRLGGEIGVESLPNQGTTFWFTLPAASE